MVLVFHGEAVKVNVYQDNKINENIACKIHMKEIHLHM